MTKSIIMLAGLPGTGKSTIAEKLEDRLDYEVHSLLRVRRDFGQKRYSPKQNPAVFKELYRKVEESVQHGFNTIVDYNHITPISRGWVYDIVKKYDATVLIIECYCSENESKRRIKKRPKNEGLVTDMREPKAYDKLAARWQDITIDLDTFSDVPISYVRYNSEINYFEEIRVSESLRPLVDIVKSAVLITNSQTPSIK